MLGLLIFPLFIVLLPYCTYAAGHHLLLPRAETTFTPGTRIEGLLNLTARQLVCPRGYGECPNNGKCCPTNYGCCPSSCCPYGTTGSCCNDGACCPSGWYCMAPSGCCPNGEVCSGAGGTFTVGGGGDDGGGDKSSLTTTTRKTTTTHKPTTDTPPTTTHEPTTREPPPPPTTATQKITTTSEPTDSDTFTASHPTPSGSSTPPSAGPGNKNVWTSVDSTEITWIGEWVSVGSTCNTTSKAKRCSGENSLDASGSMKYTFTGHSIAMTFASSNLAYSVVINEKSWSFSGTAGGLDGTASNCTYDVVYQIAVGGAQSISVQVDISEASTSSNRRSIPAARGLEERAAVDGPWHLDVNSFVVQLETADTSSGTNDPTPSPIPTSGAAWSLRFGSTPVFMMPSFAIIYLSGLAFAFL